MSMYQEVRERLTTQEKDVVNEYYRKLRDIR